MGGPYDDTRVTGPFESLGKFKEIGWYMIVGYATVRNPYAHPFVDPQWVDGPGQGVWKVNSEQEPVLLARRAAII